MTTPFAAGCLRAMNNRWDRNGMSIEIKREDLVEHINKELLPALASGELLRFSVQPNPVSTSPTNVHVSTVYKDEKLYSFGAR